jgi:hypothetical protein
MSKANKKTVRSGTPEWVLTDSTETAAPVNAPAVPVNAPAVPVNAPAVGAAVAPGAPVADPVAAVVVEDGRQPMLPVNIFVIFKTN